MATIPYKLDDITSEYSLFLDNQVLTANQLNEIVHYFEDQQRLSRILLSGVGRVCGFELAWNAGAGSIDLSCGVGVTTDGDLLHLDKKHTYTQFKSFADDNARYPPFYSGDIQYDLWEIYEGDVLEDDVPGLSGLSGFQEVTGIHPNNLAVILYVENFDKTPDICTKLDCDNLGNRQINKLHILLIKKTDLEQIINTSDTIYQTCRMAGNHFFDLPKVAGPRVILNTPRTQSFSALATAYVLAISNQLGTLQSAVTTLLEGFKWLLDPKNQTTDSSIQSKLVQVFKTGTAVADIDIQYRYDLFKDIIATYGELRSVLWDLCINCCPDVHAFPKHLMVRELVVIDEHQPQYRHRFYASPTVGQAKNDQIHKAKALYQRFVQLLFNYRKRLASPIKVTPSKMPLLPLGQRAIPFYLNTDIHKVWDADHMRFHREKEHLSYLAEDYGEVDAVQNPLEYNIDEHDFFRIEGHIGQSFNSAITTISNQIQRYQLPVEVIGLRLGDVADSINIDEYECYFEDLMVILTAWQQEQKCIWAAISKFFSGFNLKTAESHIEYGARTSDKKIKAAAAKEKKTVANAAIEIKYNLPGGTTNIFNNKLEDYGISDYYIDKKNPVEENLVKTEDYLGFVFDKVIKENANASHAEIKDLAIQQIEQIPEVKEWDAEVYTMAVDIPVNLLSLAYEVNQLKPGTMAELNVDVLDSFQLSMGRICENLKSWQSTIGKQFYKADYSRIGYEDRYQQLLSQVAVNCCAADKLKILLEEIDRRKVKILEMTMLSKYVEKHPGLEHLAGVPKGGTFVLVYKGVSKDNNERDISIGIGATEKENDIKKRLEEMLEAEAGRKSSGKTTLDMRFGMNVLGADRNIFEIKNEIGGISALASNKEYQKFLAQLMALAEEESIRANVPVGDFQVVADFALPYLCCSDCPPMSFIVPKERVSLIVQDHICFTEGMDVIDMTVVPADGEVKTDQGVNLVSKNESGNWVFDPNNLSPGLFGTPIGFTINDQITDTKTVVFHQPQPAIELIETECRFEKSVAIVTFRNITPLVAGVNFAFEWNFGDGSQDSTSSLVVTHVYQSIKPNISQKYNVSLKATNKLCSVTTDPLEVEILCQQEDPEEPKCLEVARENYAKFRELFGTIKPKDLNEFVELHSLTAEIFKNIDGNFEQVYKGEFNANLFPQLIALMEDTLGSLSKSKEERESLQLLFRIQLMLLLSILRCQDLDITEKEKELFEFLSKLPNVLVRLQKDGNVMDPDGQLNEYITAYLEAMEGDRGILRNQLNKVIEVLKQ